MGLLATSDDWCRKSSFVIEGNANARKFVDDILCWGATMQELMSKLDTILMRCKAIGITLSIKKFKISKEVAFAGYVVKQGAIRASPERAIVLKEFPSPQNIHKLRSFLGLAQQLASFVPNLAHASEPLRHLLKKEMKYWSHDLQDALATVVKILTCDLMLINFDPFWPTMLLRRIKTKRPRLCTGAHGDSDWQAEDQASDMRIAQPQPSLEILRRRQTRGPGSKARGGEVPLLPPWDAEVHCLERPLSACWNLAKTNQQDWKRKVPEVEGEPLCLQLQRGVEGGQDALRSILSMPCAVLGSARGQNRFLLPNQPEARNTRHPTQGSWRRRLQAYPGSSHQWRQRQVHL
jgi:hypothetical protein